MELKRVVVTGLGAVTPVGNTPEETWQSLVAGKSGATPITHFDTSKFKTHFACEVKGLNVNDFIDRKEARKLDRYTQLALISAMQGVKDSGIDLEKEDKERIGVVYGVGIGGIKTFEDEVTYYGQHIDEGPKFSPFFIPKMIADIASGQISIHFGFHGPNYTTTSACASSSNALADAFNLLRLGKANIIVAGGAEAAVCACGVGGFNAMHALSTRNDDPEHASRPLCDGRRSRLSDPRRARTRQSARCKDLRRDGWRGRKCRCLPHHGKSSRGSRSQTRDATRPRRRRFEARRY